MASSGCDQNINNLPDGILQEIFSYLHVEDRKTAALVCRLWEKEAFSARLLANVLLRIFHTNCPIKLKVLQNSTRKYRNVRICDNHRCEDTFEFIVAVLDKFGTTIEGFTINGPHTTAQLKVFANMIPYLKRLKIFVMFSGTRQNELPVLGMLHEMHVTFSSQEDLDVLRIAPNVQRLSLINYGHNIRVYEVLELRANQLRSLDLYISDLYSIDKLRFEKLEVLKLRLLLSNEFESHRLHNLFKGLRELKAAHLGFSISESTLAVLCSSCPKLNTLEIRAKNLTVDSFKYLNKLKNLQVFMVKDLDMRLLAQSDPVNAIKALHFDADYVENVEFVDKLYKVFPNVSSMEITNIHTEGFTTFRHICRKFIQLTKLTIIGEPLIEAIEKYNPLDNLGNVEELRFVETSTFGTAISPNRVKRLILDVLQKNKYLCINRYFPHLKHLEVRRRWKLSPEDIAMVHRKFPNCVVDYVLTNVLRAE
ncbi:uncharacterized protein LOC134291738 [Aedes albopictus]|uniref:F-box domain-containing protein n=1 Tax=Aedes albopictus TaxID=7160 RepID=A0ABM1ZQE4_AEDAL